MALEGISMYAQPRQRRRRAIIANESSFSRPLQGHPVHMNPNTTPGVHKVRYTYGHRGMEGFVLAMQRANASYEVISRQRVGQNVEVTYRVF